MINVGQAIKEELERQERTVTWLAAKVGCDRQMVYRIFKRPSIDCELLQRISIALHRDFFKELSDSLREHYTGKGTLARCRDGSDA